jgi:hypothetical protein
MRGRRQRARMTAGSRLPLSRLKAVDCRLRALAQPLGTIPP